MDVDLTVSTTTTASTCATNASLRIDTAVDPNRLHELDDASCSDLRVTGEGDVVVLDDPTGVDWRELDLVVDTGRETIMLGPAGPAGRFVLVLSAPECDDDASCDCGQLARVEGGAAQILPLGRICE